MSNGFPDRDDNPEDPNGIGDCVTDDHGPKLHVFLPSEAASKAVSRPFSGG
jgi:hypothetical protein